MWINRFGLFTRLWEYSTWISDKGLKMALTEEQEQAIKAYQSSKTKDGSQRKSSAPNNGGVTKEQASENIKNLDRSGYRIADTFKKD